MPTIKQIQSAVRAEFGKAVVTTVKLKEQRQGTKTVAKAKKAGIILANTAEIDARSIEKTFGIVSGSFDKALALAKRACERDNDIKSAVKTISEGFDLPPMR